MTGEIIKETKKLEDIIEGHLRIAAELSRCKNLILETIRESDHVEDIQGGITASMLSCEELNNYYPDLERREKSVWKRLNILSDTIVELSKEG